MWTDNTAAEFLPQSIGVWMEVGTASPPASLTVRQRRKASSDLNTPRINLDRSIQPHPLSVSVFLTDDHTHTYVASTWACFPLS